MFDTTSTHGLQTATLDDPNARASMLGRADMPGPSPARGLPRTLRLRKAGAEDLMAANGVIEAAILAWQLPERVYRLSLNAFRYQPTDLMFMSIELAEFVEGWPIAVVAHELASPTDVPTGLQGRLLHGLFVLPPHQHHGLGRLLTQRVLDAAAHDGLDGVAVRAWRDAAPFFSSLGFTLMDSTHNANETQRYWKPLT